MRLFYFIYYTCMLFVLLYVRFGLTVLETDDVFCNRSRRIESKNSVRSMSKSHCILFIHVYYGVMFKKESSLCRIIYMYIPSQSSINIIQYHLVLTLPQTLANAKSRAAHGHLHCRQSIVIDGS